MDGRPVLSCSTLAARIEGIKIVTLEGMQREAQEFGSFLANEGAEQCGFCIPGMVQCTKAHLDVNKETTEDELKYALRNNYCRCTGYVKIMDAVRLAAKCRREGVIPDASENDWDLWDEEEAQDPDGEETSEEEFWKKEGDDHSWTS